VEEIKMDYRIIGDSCLDLTPEMKEEGKIKIVPLTLQVDGVEFVDDDSFDQKKFIKAVADFDGCPKSSCPSPEDYKKAYGEDEVTAFCITLSAELSGSYNSAVLGQRLIEEEFPNKKVYVFNSRSASVGETLIGIKIQECEEAGCSFRETVERVEKYIAEQNTFFVLDDLETLRKNGRLSRVKSLVASALKIKPVMGSTDEGTICQLDQARGINKALIKMVQHVVEKTENSESKVLAISHCNCKDRAMLLKEALQEKLTTKKIIVLDTAGVSSMYANNGGVIVAV